MDRSTMSADAGLDLQAGVRDSRYAGLRDKAEGAPAGLGHFAEGIARSVKAGALIDHVGEAGRREHLGGTHRTPPGFAADDELLIFGVDRRGDGEKIRV